MAQPRVRGIKMLKNCQTFAQNAASSNPAFALPWYIAADEPFALVQLGDPILLFEKSSCQGDAATTFVNRNSFATFLSLGLIAGVVFTAVSLLPDSEQTRWQKSPLSAALYSTGSSVIFAALLAARSRMGFTAGAIGAIGAIGTIGALVGAILALSKAPRAQRLIWPILLFGSLATTVLFFLYGGGLLERVGSVESSADVRMALYEQVITMIANRPWTGFGAGSFELAFPLLHQLPVRSGSAIHEN